MMMALIIFLSYAQTLWLKMHLKEDKCRASSEPFHIALPKNLPQTLRDATIMIYCQQLHVLVQEGHIRF
jgi:hypothetical protein